MTYKNTHTTWKRCFILFSPAARVGPHRGNYRQRALIMRRMYRRFSDTDQRWYYVPRSKRYYIAPTEQICL